MAGGELSQPHEVFSLMSIFTVSSKESLWYQPFDSLNYVHWILKCVAVCALQKLIDDMMRAAENDHAAYRAGRPALFKEEMLEVRL